MVSMKRGTIALLTAAILSTTAQASDPLSFDYRVTGSPQLRPVHVFHDGQDTYIQMPDTLESKGVVIKDAVAERYGPYILVRGIPQSFTISSKAETATITYIGRPAGAVEQQSSVAETRSTPVASKSSERRSEQTEHAKAGKLTMSTTTDACAPKIVRDEAAYLIGFEKGSSRISERMANKLRASVGDPSNIEKILVVVESMKEDEAKIKALKGYLTQLGVSADKIHVERRQGGSLGAEMRIIRAQLIPCRDGITIEAPSRDQVTVLAKGDAGYIVRGIAESVGMLFRVEGEKVSLPIEISERNKPLVLVLERIAGRLDKRADIVLRNHELVIRYRQN